MEGVLVWGHTIAFLLVPHGIALLGRSNPTLSAVAGIVGLGMTVFLMPILTLYLLLALPLLLVPSIVYLIRGIRGMRNQPPQGHRVTLMSVAVLALMVAATGVLHLTEDPRCTLVVRSGGELITKAQEPCRPNNSGPLGGDVVEWSGASDVITPAESLLSIALSGSAVLLCAWAGRRTTRRTVATT